MQANRRRVLIAGIGLAWSAATAQASAPDLVRAVELTFLKATPGNRENLKKFIERNWFAMDRIAKDEGLMAAYTVLDPATMTGHGICSFR